jgi:flagellar hook-length control protein FliK
MKMMIQQLSTQSADMSAVKSTGSCEKQDANQFRSMLQTAAQKTKAQTRANDKNADRIGHKTSKKDSADKMEQTNDTQAAQSSSSEAAFALPNETVPVALKESESLLQDSAQSESNLAQVLPIDALQMQGADIVAAGEKMLPAETGQASKNASTGTTTTLGGSSEAVSSHLTSVEGQILAERQMDGSRLAAYQTTSKSSSSQTDAELPANSLGEQISQAVGENTQVQQNQNVVTIQSNTQTVIQKGEMQSSSSNSSAGENLEPQIASAKMKYTDGSGDVMPAESLSNLYGSGNVVIRVSDEMGKTLSSPIHQVANTAVYQMQNGKKEFTMELYPQSLGKVSVKMTSHSGMLTVEIAASNPKTQSLILSGSAEIRNILQAATAQNVQTVIPNQQAAQWYGQPQDGGGGNPNSRRHRQEDSRKHGFNSIASVSSELNTEDFLTMMQQIAAYAR